MIRDNTVINGVRLELKNQIDFAFSLSLRPTLLDSQIYTLATREDLIDLFQNLGSELKLRIILSKKLITCTSESTGNFKLIKRLYGKYFYGNV